MQLLIALVAGIFFLLAGILVIFVAFSWMNRDEVSNRLHVFVQEQETTTRRWSAASPLRSRELAGNITNRVFLPWVRGIARSFNRFTPSGVVDEVAQSLVIAGHPFGLGAREFLGLHLFLSFIGLIAAVVFVRRGFDLVNIAIGISIFLMFFLLPILWLRMKVRSRQKLIREDLPDALDMLSVCATAGLGFDQSLQRVSQYWNTELSKELSRVISEMEMGISRSEALRNLAQRLNVGELNSFVSLIIQSEQLGMSVSETLLAQSEQMRIERRYRALEQARKIPIKMLIPMALLIFPAILAVILGPAIPDLLGFLTDFGGGF
jgi:tight adherence protein C